MAERLPELAVPERPFRPLDLIEQPGARVGGLTLTHRASGQLMHVLPTHGDVKPIKDRLRLRRGRALHRAQARIAIG